MPTTNFDFAMSTLPNTRFEGNLQELGDLYAENLTGVFSGGVLLGKAQGDAPTSDIGIWINGSVLYSWNTAEARYLPIPVAIGRMHLGNLTITSILSTATDNRSILMPDKSGTVALTSDIFGGLPTIGLGGTTPSINWTGEGKNYYLTLSGNSTITHTGAVDGQSRTVWVENPASGIWTVAFPGVIWEGGFPPTQSTDVTGNIRAIDRYEFEKIGNYIFGRKSQNFKISTSGGSGGDITAPTYISSIRTNNAGLIAITMSEALQGNTYALSDFEVKKNGVVQTVVGAGAGGADVINVYASTGFSATNVITLRYTGASSSIKDFAGNLAVAFGPVTVQSSNATGGGGGGGGGGQNEF